MYSKYLTANESMGYVVIRVIMLLQVETVSIGDSPCAGDPELVGGCRVRAAG